MAKTAWNAIVTGDNTDGAQGSEKLKNELRVYLTLCQKILGIFGPEGDTGGPQDEIRTLQELSESS